MKKIKTGIMLHRSIIDLCDNNLVKSNSNSRNHFVEKSILFYVDYLKSKNNVYLHDALDKSLESKLNLLEDRVTQMLFKQSVELNILNHIVAIISELDQETIDLLRKKSIQEVKETSGKISLDVVIKNGNST